MDWKRYGIYHARWQLSTIVMAAPIAFFNRYFGAVVALAFAQVIGACVFWYVDAWIFDEDRE